jgi:nucleotide-binding universal stress UspA family protein
MYAAFNSILVAMDGREGGVDAAALAGVLAGTDADVAIAHVLTAREGRAPIAATADTPVLTARAPSVAAGLHRLVEEHGADLLAIGAHHHGHLSRDHTRAALRDLPCAIAVAPAGYASRPRRPIRAVGVGFVDDRAGRAVLDTARGLAWQLGAEVHATIVVGPSNWESAESGMGWRAAAAARRMAEIPGVHGVAVEGRPQQALGALSRTVDLLVVGSRHHPVARRLRLSDVAEGLSHSSRCPLLVVPHGA